MSKTRELDKQIAALYRQLADLHDLRAAAMEAPAAPTASQSAPAWAVFLGVGAQTIRRRAHDGKPLLGYYVERVSARLFRLVPCPPPPPQVPKEREGARRMRLLQQFA